MTCIQHNSTPMPVPLPCWHLYVIRTVDDRLYTGITTDVQRRFGDHLSGDRKAAKYLIAHRPDRVVFSMPVGSRSHAAKAEYAFKSLTRAEQKMPARRKIDDIVEMERNGA